MYPTESTPFSIPHFDGAGAPSARPTRVLYCIEKMGPGGTEKQLAALVQHLDRSLVVPHLCTLRPSETDVHQVGCEVLQLSFTSFRSLTTFRAVRRLRSFVRERGIDSVQSFFQDPTILGYLATIGSQVVRVASFRDMGFWRTSGKALQLRHVYSRYNGFVANSGAVARRFHELEGIPLERIRVIHNGVDVPRESGREECPDCLVVGIVANLNRPVKRVELFLHAARVIADAMPQTRFVIVGDGHLRPTLAGLCATLGLTDVVSFKGRNP